MSILSTVRQILLRYFNSRVFEKLLLLIMIIAFVANFPFADGEDVNNARRNFHSADRNDFWGGFSSFFYSFISDNIVDSNILYALIYLILIALGSFGIHSFLQINQEIYTRLRKSLLLFLTLITSMFALQFSRDGTLLAFIWASLGLFLWGYSKKLRIVWLPLSVVLFVMGMSFRPWLGLVTIPLSTFILARLDKFKKITLRNIAATIFAVLALILAPIVGDRAVVKALDMSPAYPQQQVMILDASSLACLSANSSTIEKSLDVLGTISNLENLSLENLCASFYPQNWASVVFYQKSNAQKQSPIRLINPSEQQVYETFSRGWLDLIFKYPKDYVQTKLMLSSQLLLAGESRKNENDILNALLVKPLNIFRDLRIFSVLPFSLLLFFFTSLRRESKSKIETLSITFFYFVGIFSVAIAFVGDNQRYMIPTCLITSLLLIIQHDKCKDKRGA